MTLLSNRSFPSPQSPRLGRREASINSHLVNLLWLRRWRQEHRILIVLSTVFPRQLNVLVVRWAQAQFSVETSKRVVLLALSLQIVTGAALSLVLMRLTPVGEPLVVVLAGLATLALPLLLGASSWRHVGVFPFQAYLIQAPIQRAEVARLMMLSELRFVATCRSSVWWAAVLFFGQTLVAFSPQHSPFSIVWTALAAIFVAAVAVPSFLTGARVGVLYAKQRLQGRVGTVASVRYATLAAVFVLIGYCVINVVVVTTLSTARLVFATMQDLQSDERWKEFGVIFLEQAIPEQFKTGDGLSFLVLEGKWITPILISGSIFAAASIFYVWRKPLQILDLATTAQPGSSVPDFLDALIRFIEATHMNRSHFEKRYVRSLTRHSWAIRPGFLGLVFPTLESWCYFGGGVALLFSGIEESTACFLLAVLATFMVHNQATETREALMPVLGPALDRAQVSLHLQAPTARMLHGLTVARVRVHRRFLVPSTCCSVTALVLVAVLTGHYWAGLTALVAALSALTNATWVQWYMSALLMIDGASDRRHEQGEGSWTAEAQSTMQGWVRYVIVVLPGILLLVVLIAGALLPPAVDLFGVALTVLAALTAAAVLPHLANSLSARAWRTALSPKAPWRKT